MGWMSKLYRGDMHTPYRCATGFMRLFFEAYNGSNNVRLGSLGFSLSNNKSMLVGLSTPDLRAHAAKVDEGAS